jgi:tripeptidyl-peptidase-1
MDGPTFVPFANALSQVEKLVAPSSETVQLVTEWLETHGVSAQTITAAGDWLSFSVPVSKAQDMFDANFDLYQHGDSGRKVVRTMAYSIPTHLKGHVELMYPGISYVS